jgi:hypothetical protein
MIGMPYGNSGGAGFITAGMMTKVGKTHRQGCVSRGRSLAISICRLPQLPITASLAPAGSLAALLP